LLARLAIGLVLALFLFAALVAHHRCWGLFAFAIQASLLTVVCAYGAVVAGRTAYRVSYDPSAGGFFPNWSGLLEALGGGVAGGLAAGLLALLVVNFRVCRGSCRARLALAAIGYVLGLLVGLPAVWQGGMLGNGHPLNIACYGAGWLAIGSFMVVGFAWPDGAVSRTSLPSRPPRRLKS